MYPHFVQDAVESANNYYNYVQATQNGRVIVKVTAVSVIAPDLYRVTLEKRLKNPDAAALCIKSHLIDMDFYSDPKNRFIDKKYFSLVKIEDDGVSMTVSIKEDFCSIFPNIPIETISFVSDLSFLIKNVEEWYLDYGHFIRRPDKPTFPVEQIYTSPKDSKEQIKATRIAMTQRISYIWGAPGTGKTQVVLANCIMSYLLQNPYNQVLLLAPTNNALEQTLRAIIKTLIDLGKNIDCLYRLGISSEAFAHQFGEICENLDQLSKMETLSQEIQSLKKKQELSSKANNLIHEYEKFIELIKKHEELQNTEKELPLFIVEYESQINNLEKAFESTSEELLQNQLSIKQISTKECSVLYKIKKLLSSNGEAQLTELRAQKIFLENNVQILKNKIPEITKEIQTKKHLLQNAKDESLRISSRISSTESEIEKKAKKILGHFSSVEDSKREFTRLVADCKSDFVENLAETIAKKEAILLQLQENYSNSLQEKRIYAFTLDFFYAHYEELSIVGLNSSRLVHAFLDEAAYCPLIKAGILFSLGIPVTFLGDHMQLSPICEAADNVTLKFENKIFLWELSAIYLPQIFDRDVTLENIFERFISIREAKDITQIKYYSEKNLKTAALTQTFRFGNELANILNTFVYQNGFRGNSEIKTQITVLHGKHHPGEKERRSNFGEAEAIKTYLQEKKPTDYAIITPYRAQCFHLQKFLSNVDPDDILTIHSSQGREWDTIIISVVDSDNQSMFLTNSRIPQGLHTLNTAISRARKNIVIACDTDFWQTKNQTQLIGQLINPCPLPSPQDQTSQIIPSSKEISSPKQTNIKSPRKKTSPKPKQINITWSQKNRELYKRGIEIGHLENAIEQKTHTKFISKIEIPRNDPRDIKVHVLSETSKDDVFYETTLQKCTCKSFQYPPQRVPAACKHMFALALRLKVVTPNGRLNDSITIPSRNVSLLP